MKFNYGINEFPSLKNTPLLISKIVVLLILSLFLLTMIPIYLYDDASRNSLLKSLAIITNNSTPHNEPNISPSSVIALTISTPLLSENNSRSPTNSSAHSTSLNPSLEKNRNVTSLSLSLESSKMAGSDGIKSARRMKGRCNLFKGEWIRYTEGPYYTNETKCVIDDRQNCMKFGRPDREYLKWRWKPYECELPLFDARQFLEVVKGKTLGFLGDSVGRNQMQSLVCLLASAAYPVDVSYTPDTRFRRWLYTDYDFTILALWSPLLVKFNEPRGDYLTHLYLDEADQRWTAQIGNIDILIISAGQWFFRPFLYYEKGKLIGCYKCNTSKQVKEFTPYYGYMMAFRTVFNTILGIENFTGSVYLRTFSPAHFEYGDDNSRGKCERERPFKKGERELEWFNLEFYKNQVREFRVAKRRGRKKGLKFKLLDTTEAMFLRADGHPSKYGHWAHENKTADCVHWCLPGPIDTWNEFFLEILKMESA